MTVIFRHTAGNTIYMDDGAGNTLHISLDTFLSLEPAYSITDGAINPSLSYKYREYTPEVKHTFITTDSNMGLGVMPWLNGDTYLSKVAEYIDIINNPTVDLPTAKNIKSSALSAYYSQKISSGGISLFSTTMPSNAGISQETESYTRQGFVPVDFYLKNSAGGRVTLNLSDLQSYNDGLVKMRWIHRSIFDDHYDAIQALTTVEDVEAYDFETGWPTLPFDPTFLAAKKSKTEKRK